MKTTLLLVIGVLAGQHFFVPAARAQAYSPRRLTRQVPNLPNRPGNPAPSQPAPARPAPPAAPAQPQTPAVPAQNVATNPPPAPRRVAPVVVQRPVDPEKARAAQEEAQRKAVEFQKQRAAEDFGWAQLALGVRYMTGNGVEKDYDQARKLLEKAAKNGEGQARSKLAELDRLIQAEGETAEPPAPSAKAK